MQFLWTPANPIESAELELVLFQLAVQIGVVLLVILIGVLLIACVLAPKDP